MISICEINKMKFFLSLFIFFFFWSKIYCQIIRIVPIELVYVEGGTFKMYDTIDTKEKRIPVIRNTRLSSFYIGIYEVTQRTWRDVMGTYRSLFKNCDDCPVDNMTWDDVQEFLEKLNILTGKKYRLPTEAEWEYAARGGNRSKNYKFSGSNNIDEVGWNKSNSGGISHKVGMKKPNELGIFDMTGNVSEWCNDCYYGNDNYDMKDTINPQCTLQNKYKGRFRRGGAWNNNQTIYKRSMLAKDMALLGLDGFRLCLPIK
jgi:formylglycine-generating enzyme required for sulfatase activity